MRFLTWFSLVVAIGSSFMAIHFARRERETREALAIALSQIPEPIVCKTCPGCSASHRPIVLIGDSIMERMPSKELSPYVLNLGIDGNTTAQVAARIGRYDAAKEATVIVVAVGVNDLQYGAKPETVLEQYQKILDAIPPHVPVVCSAVLPVTTKYVRQFDREPFNQGVQKLAAARCGARYIDPGLKMGNQHLKESFSVDGAHLSPEGYKVLIEELGSVIPALRESEAGK